MRTLDQIRAEYAWGRVQNPSKEYRNLAKSLPALVMSNGLMQSLAFLQGKGKDDHSPHGRLLKDVLDWLINPQVKILQNGEGPFSQAMTAVTKMSSLDYQRATEESIAMLRWIRHLVDTLLPEADHNENK
jgi:CRISPR-associated protein Cmr5